MGVGWARFIMLMGDSLMKLYLQRLESFTQTLSYLHEIVGVDQALALLKDERLVQYKMDRIAQLVREMLTSEKEKVIIQLILKIEAMQHKSDIKEPKDTEPNQSELVYYRKRLEQKNQEIERAKNENNILRQQREEHKKVSNQLKIQFEIYQNKYKEIKQKWERFEQLKQSQAQAEAQNIESTFAKTKQLQQQIERHKEKNGEFQKRNEQLQSKVNALKQQNQSLASQLQQIRQFTCKQKIEKMEKLKKEVVRLGNDLNQMKEMTKIILDYINKSLSAELNTIKKDMAKLTTYILNELKTIFTDLSESFESKLRALASKGQSQRGDDGLIKRMQDLENELAKFIHTNGI